MLTWVVIAARWALGTRIGRWVSLAALAVVGLGLALLRAYGAGRRAERQRQQDRKIEAMEKANEVERDVDRLPDGGAADRLRERWSRD